MAIHQLSESFAAFFGKLNPDDARIKTAASEHAEITRLITDANGPAAVLSPRCFLQGSYKQQTAIYDINDVDVVALCQLWYPPNPGAGVGPGWSRDQIFDTIAAAVRGSPKYATRVQYGSQSMCIKVNASMKIEILPVVYTGGNYDPDKEPFVLFRPETQTWVGNGFARYHQQWLTWKNAPEHAQGNFIPAVKIFKHIRSRFHLETVSFHVECFLFRLPDNLFVGSPADYLSRLFNHIAAATADNWYASAVRTPCSERDIFTATEWGIESWRKFHEIITLISGVTSGAVNTSDRAQAVKAWQMVLGDEYFPAK